MSLNINLNIDDASKKESTVCHMLPCKIKLNGFCKVSNYFTPYIRNDENTMICSIRGHPLEGQKVKVPDGYSGFVLKENKQWSSDSDNKELKATGTFKEFTAWNWDKTPSEDDKVVKALDWISVANILHKPVTEDESKETKSEKSPQKQRKRKLSE